MCGQRHSRSTVRKIFLLAMLCLAPCLHAGRTLAGDAPGKRCEQHPQGTVDCQRTDNGNYQYSWPVTPDMVGQTVDASSLSLGVAVFPPVQRVAAGQSRVSFEVTGAKPGQLLRVAKKLLRSNPETVDGTNMCCIESYDVKVPEAPPACKQTAMSVPPGRPPTPRSTPQKRPKVEIDKKCPSCAAGAKCQCIVTVHNVGTDIPSDTIQLQDEANLIGNGDNAAIQISEVTPDGDDWECLRSGSSVACTLPASSLRPITSRSIFVTYEPMPSGSMQPARIRNCARFKNYAQTVSLNSNAESCVEFTALPRCPGDLVLQGPQCGCPGNAERYDDDRCRPTCAAGEDRKNGTCIKLDAAAPAKVCPAGYSGIYPDCSPAVQSNIVPPTICPAGYSGTYPECSPVVVETKQPKDKPQKSEVTGGRDGSNDDDEKEKPRKRRTEPKECSGEGEWPNCCKGGQYFRHGECRWPVRDTGGDEPVRRQPQPQIQINPDTFWQICYGRRIPVWKKCKAPYVAPPPTYTPPVYKPPVYKPQPPPQPAPRPAPPPPPQGPPDCPPGASRWNDGLCHYNTGPH